LVPEYEEVFSHVLGVGVYRKSDKTMYIEMDGIKAKIFFGSADKPESLESATAKAAHLDEVGQKTFKLDSWEAILRRLSINQGRVLGTTTLYNFGWMKTQVYNRWVEGDKDFDIIQVSSITNPAFPKEEYYRAQRTLPTWKFDLFYRGLYTKPAGMVYDCFDDTKHVIKPFALNPKWSRYAGYDFGGVNTAGVWIAEEPFFDILGNEKPIYYLYREYLNGGLTIGEHSNNFKTLTAGERIVRHVGGSHSEEQWRRDFAVNGIPIQEPDIKDVEVGIQRVYSLIKENRLFIFNTCPNTIDQFNSYSRVLGENDQPTDKIQDKEAYHYIDATRYIGTFLNREDIEEFGGGASARD
jgi:hypothetical protein